MTAPSPTLPLALTLGLLLSSVASSQDDNAVASLSPEPAAASATAEAPDEPAAPAPAEPEPDPDTLRQAASDRRTYENVIDRLQEDASQNIYNPELTEAYLNLAGTLTTLRQFEEAAGVYDQALQNARISNGLNSPVQIPILARSIESFKTLGDWQRVDADFHLIYHIARRNYPVGDEHRIQALNDLVDWKLEAASRKLVPQTLGDAMKIAEIYDREIQLLEAAAETPGKRYEMASLYLGKAKAGINVTREFMEIPRSEYRTGGSSSTMTQRCFNVRLPNGTYQLICQTVEVPNMDYYIDPQIQKDMNIGRELRDIREDIVDAYKVLQTADDDPQRRDAMLSRVQDVTNYYNAFVNGNGL